MKNFVKSELLNSDEVILKLAEKLGITIRCRSERIKVSKRKLVSEATDLGGGMVRYAHRVWRLKKEGEDFFLERMEDEQI